MLLQDDLIRLRALEPEDAEAMYRWENDTTLWRLGDTTRPFSQAAIREFIAGASLDLYAARQMRLMIDLRATGETIGCADLFDFDPLHRRAGIGMLIGRYKVMHALGGTVRVIHMDGQIRRILSLSGVGKLIHLEEEAV